MDIKKRINLWIAFLCFMIAILLYFRLGFERGWRWIAFACGLGILHLLWTVEKRPLRKPSGRPPSPWGREGGAQGTLTEVVLLSEEGDRLAAWDIYQKNGVVIGRDLGENEVAINLDQTTYASMIDVEHAVLNYCGKDWYIEDISKRNGVSIQKGDGRRYKLSYGKPCKLEQGDIIFIAMTRLQIL